MSEKPAFVRVAHESDLPIKTGPLSEKPATDLDLAKERALRNFLDEVRSSGSNDLSTESIEEAKGLVSRLDNPHAVNAINMSSESDWRKSPAAFVAYLDLIDSHRDQVTPGN